MNVTFIDARKNKTADILAEVLRREKTAIAIHSIADENLKKLINGLNKNPELKLHTNFKNVSPKSKDVFLIEENADFGFDGKLLSKVWKVEQKSNYDFKSIIEFSLNEVYIFNTVDFKFKFVNQGALDNLGYTLAQIQQMSPLDIKPEYTERKFRILVKPLLEGLKDKIVFETIHKRADKSTYPVEVHLQIMEQNGVPFFVAVILDITEWKKSISKMTEAKSHLDLLAQNYPDGSISLIDKELKILFTDGEGYHRHDINPKTFVGMPAKEVLAAPVYNLLENASQKYSKLNKIIYDVPYHERIYQNTLKAIFDDKREFKFFILKVLDVTDIRKKTREVEIEKNKFASIYNALNKSALVSITDISGNIIHANPEFCKASKYEEEELLGRNHSIINSCYHPKSFWTDMWKKVLSGKTWRAEVKNKAKDGSYYWVDTVINPIKDTDGKITSLLSIRNLITDKKELEIAKDRLADKLSLATKAAKMGVWTWNLKTGEVIWDDQMKKIYGREEFGETIESFAKSVHPEDVDVLFKEVNAQISKHKGFNFTFRIIKDNGDIAFIKAMSSQELINGSELLIGVNWDITIEKQSQDMLMQLSNKLQLATKAAKMGTWTWDIESNEITWDAINHELYGLKEYDGSFDRFLSLIHPDDAYLIHENADRVLKGEDINYSFRVLKPEGKVAWLNAMASLESLNGKKTIIGVNLDITQQKLAEQELKKKNEELAKLEEFIDHSSDAIQVSDESGRLVYLNDTAAERLGIIKEETTDYYVKDFEVLFENDDHWKNHIKELKKKGRLTLESININQETTLTIPVEVTITYQKIGGTGYVIASSRDITERKEAEKRLKDSQLKYELALKGSKDGFWEYNVVKNELFFSTRYYQILGLTAKKGDNHPDYWDTNVHPEYAKRNKEIVAKALNSNAKTYEIESLRKHADGHYVPVLVRAFISRDKEGAATQVTGTMMDLTRIKAVENKLRESEKKYELALKGSNDGFWDLDLITNTIEYSNSYLKILGHKKAERDYNPKFWQDRIHPDDQERIVNRVQHALESNATSYELESRRLHTDGHYVPVLVRAFISRDKNGVATRVTGTMMDLTKTKESELRVANLLRERQELINSLDGIVWEGDPESLNFTFISNQVENILGYKQDEWYNESGLGLNHVHPDDYKWVKEFCDSELQKMNNFSLEYRMLHKNGEVVWIKDNTSVIVEDGKVRKLQGILIDITALKNAEKVITKLKDEYANLLNSVGGIIWKADAETFKFTFVSNQSEKLTGFTPDHWLKDGFWVNNMHPEDQRWAPSFFMKAAESKEDHVFEYRFIRKDGKVIWLRDIVTVVTKKDQTTELNGIMLDITEFKNNQLALKDSEERFKAIANNMPGVVYQSMNDASFSKTYLNDEVEKLTGYSKEEFLSNSINFVDLFHPDDKAHVIKKVETALKNHQPFQLTYRLYNKSIKDYIWVEEFGQGVFDDRELNYIEGVILNIHYSKLTAIALQESEEMLFDIANNIPGLVLRYVILPDGTDKIQFVSDGCLELWEISKEEVLADVNKVWAKIHPDDLSRFTRSIEKSAETGNTWQEEWRFIMDDGRVKWISGIGQPKKLENGAVLWHTLQLDITDKKNAEITLEKTLSQLNLSIETGKLGIWESDLSSGNLEWNDQMFEIFNINKQSFDYRLETFTKMVHPEDLDNANAEMGQIANGKLVRDVRFRIIRPNGQIRHIYASGAPVYNKKGEVEKFLGINIDVTNVAEYQEQLEATLQEKDALFKELHHRIKNNLQMVSSLLFIKSTMTEDLTLRRFIDETSTKIHSISSIHEQLLQMQGVNKLDIKDYLESLCKTLIHTYSYGNTMFNLQMELDSADMNIDRVLNVGLIVNEIISNTMKYAYPDNEVGNILIKLKIKGNNAVLRVADEGIGIPDNKMNEIDNSYGMQLISLFTKQIKGTLEIDNSEGTKYVIKFPTNV